MRSERREIITGYAKLWPREVFSLKRGKKLLMRDEKLLEEPGVYVLYRDDRPYYVGKTAGRPLWERIQDHANEPKDTYYNFWNYFSAFVVPEKDDIGAIERILIAAMPTAANGARPRIKPSDVLVTVCSRSITGQDAANSERISNIGATNSAEFS